MLPQRTCHCVLKQFKLILVRTDKTGQLIWLHMIWSQHFGRDNNFPLVVVVVVVVVDVRQIFKLSTVNAVS